MGNKRQSVSCQQGQAVVEFALVLPVLIMLLLGIIQTGLVLHAYLTAQFAAREGARSAAVGSSDTVITTQAKSAAQAGGSVSNVTVSITPSTRSSGDAVTVTVSVPNPMSGTIPFVSAVFPSALTGTAVMRVEPVTSD